jgi:hypothetical protein
MNINEISREQQKGCIYNLKFLFQLTWCTFFHKHLWLKNRTEFVAYSEKMLKSYYECPKCGMPQSTLRFLR